MKLLQMPRARKNIGEPMRLHLRPLALYEDMLLNALAFFRTQRKTTTQAHQCLSMYLRQSEARIMSEVGFYAHLLDMEPREFLALIYTDPDTAEKMITEVGIVSPVADEDDDPDDED